MESFNFFKGISFFKYEGAKPKWQALGRMGRPPIINQPIEGLTFWKPLGSTVRLAPALANKKPAVDVQVPYQITRYAPSIPKKPC